MRRGMCCRRMCGNDFVSGRVGLAAPTSACPPPANGATTRLSLAVFGFGIIARIERLNFAQGVIASLCHLNFSTNTVTAGPLSITGWPGPAQSMVKVPPRISIATGASSKPRKIPVTAAAQPPCHRPAFRPRRAHTRAPGRAGDPRFA